MSQSIEAIGRYQMAARAEILTQPQLNSITGLFLITADQLGVAHEIASLLPQMGASTAIISTETLLNPQLLQSEISTIRQNQGAITGIIHLAALTNQPVSDDIGQWRHYTQIDCKSLFQLLQLCADDIQKDILMFPQVLAASLLGGKFGRDGSADIGLATGGGSNGLLKTMMLEWAEVKAKAIDFDSSFSPKAIAQHILHELLVPSQHTEIGYCQGQRLVFEPVLSPVDPTKPVQLQPQSNWVVLITGGARGITAEIANELLVPGMTMILVGRSPEPAEEALETKQIEDISQLRQLLLAQSKGLAVTPVQIEKQLQRLWRDRSIRRNLDQFRTCGATVEYHSLDVTDADQFGSLITEIYTRYGRLDAVIHGAGTIADKLIIDKSLSSFEAVFDTKVDSTFILSRHLRPDLLKLLVLFTSVAGRFGNRGQSDYTAANEVVNRLAWQLDQRWTKTRVVAINWGPWDITGMASESVNRQFRERGVIPITPSAGRHFFTQEIYYGNKGETELIAGVFPGLPQKIAPQPQDQPHTFLFSQPQLQPNGTVTLEHTFSLSSEPFLNDHRLDHKPVLPAAAALEWMAQFVQAAWSEWVVTEVHNLRVLRGITLEEASKKVLFIARASTHADAESLQVAAEILDIERKLPFYRATFILSAKLEQPPLHKPTTLNSGNNLDVAEAYQNYCFHGKSFQLLTAIDRLNHQGIDAIVLPSQPSAWLTTQQLEESPATWLFDPGIIDALQQLALIWTRVQADTTVLPSRFGRVIRYGQSSLEPHLNVALRVNNFDNHILVYDAIFTDQNHHIRLLCEDIEMTCSTALNRLNTLWRSALANLNYS